MKFKHRIMLWLIGLGAFLYGAVHLKFGIFGYLNGQFQPTYSAGTIGLGVFMILLGFLPGRPRNESRKKVRR